MSTYEEALDAFRAGENERASQLSEQALEAARAVGDESGQIDSLCMLARVALRQGDFRRVRELADEARACARTAGEERLERMPLHMQAVAARMAGDRARKAPASPPPTSSTILHMATCSVSWENRRSG